MNSRQLSVARCAAAPLALALTFIAHGCTLHEPPAEQLSAELARQSACLNSPLATRTAEATAGRLSNCILQALIETNGVPGMAAALWRDDSVAWIGSAGYRDVEQGRYVDENTVFRLASVSKVFAVTAAAKLREQGTLDVDAPVRSIVPYLTDAWPPITTAQLAAHTSGIPHYQLIDAGRGGRRFETTRAAVAVFDDRDLLFAPGTQYSYSSYGFTLLSAVVEETAERAYLDYLSDNIIGGLAIGRDLTDSGEPDASIAYEFSGGTTQVAAPHDYSYSWGGAGLGATAPALAQFGGRLLAGEIVSHETLDWMLTPVHLADGSPVMDREGALGFGWRTQQDIDGERIAHHAGVTNGARSTLVLYPDRRLAISLLSNASWVSSIEQTALMLAAPFMATTPARPVACPTEAVAFDGEYDGATIAGMARVVSAGDTCVAIITAQNAFGEWVNGFPQNAVETLTLIGIDPDGGFSRAALVTPIGVYDLRAEDRGSRHVARLGGTRTVTISLRTE